MKSSRTITRRAMLTAAATVALAWERHPAIASPSGADGLFDVLIYGATPAGVAAAASAARLGRRVVLVELEDHIGGIVSNGLTNADIGKRQAVGGFFYEFVQRVLHHYQHDDPGKDNVNVKHCHDGYWYEAALAEKIFHDFLAEQGDRVTLALGHELKSVALDKGKLILATFERTDPPGQKVTLAARTFIDATYEGDLAAVAGAPFTVGRESREQYKEPLAGFVYTKLNTNELLPGSTGAGDKAVQAFCFRFHVTNVPEKRIPIEKPVGFHREDYYWELQDVISGKATRFSQMVQVYSLPNGMFELNSSDCNVKTGVPRESLDLAEDNWNWPLAERARRREIYRRYLSHNVGLVWLLQNDPQVPEKIRMEASEFGWCKNLWSANGHMPRQVYVREGRRILGQYFLTQHDGDLDPAIERTKLQPTSIAVIEWDFDSHACHKYNPARPGAREGYTLAPHAPFQMPYGALVPQKVENLLVPVACSASHVAYNALRMEPVFMALGQVCGMAAHLALRDGAPIGGIDVRALQHLLVERGGVITFYSDLKFNDPLFPAFQWLGARGLNKGYLADASRKLTRSEGAEKLRRILVSDFQGVQMPVDPSQARLEASHVAAWLAACGHPVRSTKAPTGPLTLGQFAQIVYGAMAPVTPA